MRLVTKLRPYFFMVFVLASCSVSKYQPDIFPPKKEESFEKYAQDNFKRIVDNDPYLKRLSFNSSGNGWLSITGTPSRPESDRLFSHAISVFDNYCHAYGGKRGKLVSERGAAYACIENGGERRIASVFIYSDFVIFESGQKFELKKFNSNMVLMHRDTMGPGGTVVFSDGSKASFIRLGTLWDSDSWFIENPKDKRLVHISSVKSIDEKNGEVGYYNVTLMDMQQFSVSADRIGVWQADSSENSLNSSLLQNPPRAEA